MRRAGSTASRRWEILLLAALWLGHGVWVLRNRGVDAWARKGSQAVVHPLLGISGRFEAWQAARRVRNSDLRQAQGELQQLRAQVQQFQLQRSQEAPRLAEGADAVRLLGLRQLLPLELRAARILANLRRAPYGGLVLDQGLDAGLVPDQGVIAPEGIVGRVWQVGTRQCTVLPLDAYNASTGVMLARSRATGVLLGTGPGRAEIRYISSQEIVQPGEQVFTSGLDGVFPRGLLVGTVSRVRPREIELGVEVALAAPLDRLALVLLLPPSPPLELQAPAPPPTAPKTKAGTP